MECLECGTTPALKKCSNCKIAWFCSKECQTKGWKKHKKYCIKDEYLIWSQKEKLDFYVNINNLQTSYKNKVTSAVESFKLANGFLNELLKIQNSYNKESQNYDQVINISILHLRDSETEWRLLQTHTKEMYNLYHTKTDDWSLTLSAFYEQLNIESIHFRTLICLSLAHCYFSLRLHLINNKNNTDIITKLYNECKNYYELALLYKSKITIPEYIDDVSNFMIKLEKIKRFMRQLF